MQCVRNLIPFLGCVILASCVLVAAGLAPASAQAVGKGITNLELPRFVSLKARRANLRVGPGKAYAVSWMFLKPGIPMEVVQEFDYWRRVRYADGTEGWIFHSLLSGKRTVITAPWDEGSDNVEIPGHAKPNKDAAISARFAPGVLASVDACDGEWCRISHEEGSGWVEQKLLWGVYPNETLGK